MVGTEVLVVQEESVGGLENRVGTGFRNEGSRFQCSSPKETVVVEEATGVGEVKGWEEGRADSAGRWEGRVEGWEPVSCQSEARRNTTACQHPVCRHLRRRRSQSRNDPLDLRRVGCV